MGDKPVKMDGAVNLKMDVKTSGDTVNQLKQASKGVINLDMKQTRVDGFDPEFYMRSAIADYVHSKGFALSESIMGKYQPREVTVFDKIHSTVNLANGIARTDDFLMDSKRVKVTAKGHANIIENTLDVVSTVQLPRAKTGVEKIFAEPVSVRIHGPFNALKYELDKDKLKKSTTDVLENEAKAELKAKADAEKQRLKEKAKQELKKSTDKLEDKLKNKLKGFF
jgi:AsmA protein